MTVPVAAMQMPLQPVMMTQGVLPVHGMCKNSPRVPRQSFYRGMWSYMPSPCRLMGQAAHRFSRDCRYGSQQMPRRRIAVKRTRHFTNALGQMRS